MTRILWISPVGRDRSLTDIESILVRAAKPNTEVQVRCLDRGPHHVEYHYYEALVLPDLLHLVKRAEHEDFDATVLGCFYDLGLEEAREISETMPVTAPAEATTHLATTMGDTFSVIVGRRKWVPQMRERIRRYGFGERLASFKPVDLGVLDFQADHETTVERLRTAGREAVEEDGAEVVILGCTAEYGFYRDLQDDIGVPVLDAVTAPFKFAELLADLRQFGWTHSKVGGYESPPSEEVFEWNLPEQYETMGVWEVERATDERSVQAETPDTDSGGDR